MTPTNTAITPEIKNIADKNGDKHTVIPTQHSHTQSEVEGLTATLAGKSNTSHTHKSIQYNPSVSTDGFAGFASSDAGSFGIEVLTDKRIYFQFGSIIKASITNSNVDNLARALRNPDTTPTASSDNLITSGGVKAALNGKVNNKEVIPEVFIKSDPDKVIDLEVEFDDNHNVSNYILQNALLNDDCSINDFFEANDGNLYYNNATIPRDSYAIVKVVYYDDGTNRNYFIIIEGIYEQ